MSIRRDQVNNEEQRTQDLTRQTNIQKFNRGEKISIGEGEAAASEAKERPAECGVMEAKKNKSRKMPSGIGKIKFGSELTKNSSTRVVTTGARREWVKM